MRSLPRHLIAVIAAAVCALSADALGQLTLTIDPETETFALSGSSSASATPGVVTYTWSNGAAISGSEIILPPTSYQVSPSFFGDCRLTVDPASGTIELVLNGLQAVPSVTFAGLDVAVSYSDFNSSRKEVLANADGVTLALITGSGFDPIEVDVIEPVNPCLPEGGTETVGFEIGLEASITTTLGISQPYAARADINFLEEVLPAGSSSSSLIPTDAVVRIFSASGRQLRFFNNPTGPSGPFTSPFASAAQARDMWDGTLRVEIEDPDGGVYAYSIIASFEFPFAQLPSITSPDLVDGARIGDSFNYFVNGGNVSYPGSASNVLGRLLTPGFLFVSDDLLPPSSSTWTPVVEGEANESFYRASLRTTGESIDASSWTIIDIVPDCEGSPPLTVTATTVEYRAATPFADLLPPLPGFCPADFNGDFVVDGSDFGVFGAAFGSSAGDAEYDERADFNDDGVIDGADFGAFGAQFGNGAAECAP
jgi:hypothetical protein